MRVPFKSAAARKLKISAENLFLLSWQSLSLRSITTKQPMKKIQPFIFAALIAAITPAFAQSLSWDGNNSGGSNLGGSGNWDTNVDALWFNGAVDVVWTNNLDADFTGTAGTVTLVDNVSASDLYFTNTTGNYFITNATGAEVLTINGTIDTGGGEHFLAAPIANSGTLNKNGNGRIHLLQPNNLNTIMINQGQLSVETNNGAGSSGSITVANGAALEFAGGNSTNGFNGFNPSINITGSGVTNGGAIRNVNGVNNLNGDVTLSGNSTIYSGAASALVLQPLDPLSDGGNSYNLTITGPGNLKIITGGIQIENGTVILGPGANAFFYFNGLGTSDTEFNNSIVSTGATLYIENNNGFGTQPATLMTTNCVLDGGSISSAGTSTMYPTTGITATTNGGTLIDTSGTWTTGNIYSSNAAVTLNAIGSMRPGGAAGTTLGTINLGTGTLIKSGTGDCNLGYANASLEIYSNIQVNGTGSLTFNYDSTGGTGSLGAVPNTLNPSNIWMNGGSLHVGHSTTIAATRGIYVTTAGGTIEDVVSSGGTVTINSPISGPGSMSFIDGHGGTTSGTVLAANNTYAGTTTIGISNVLTVGAGGSTGTLGMSDTVANGRLVFNRTGSYTYNGNISGFSNLVNSGSGTITLGGSNSYTGPTTCSAGSLLLTGLTNASSAITVSSGATLGGTSTLGGTVTVSAGGTLALGSGTLSVSNNVSIAGNVSVSVNNSSSPSSGEAIVTGTLANSGTGTVSVSNLGPALATGNTFQLFNGPVSGGNTMTISGVGVQWANNLASSGSISVVGPLPHPVINKVSYSGTGLIMSGTNGYTGGGYYVLATTNLLLPLTSWTPVLTNTFATGGTFSITNPVVAGTPAKFYTLKLQ